MRKLTFAIVLAIAAFTFQGGTSVQSQTETRFMAFCNDGDGPVSDWIDSRNDAYLRGRDHERAFRGHRWEVLMQSAATDFRTPSCAIVSDGERPGTLRLENTCGECRVFRVSRTTTDGHTANRDLTVKPNGRRLLRKAENAEVRVEGEGNCPGK